MKFTSQFILVCILASTIGCQSPMHRKPSSEAVVIDWSDLRDLRQRKVELEAMNVHYKKNNDLIKLEEIKPELKKLEKLIVEVETRIMSSDRKGTQAIHNESVNWRYGRESIELSNLDLYKLDKNVQLSVSTFETKKNQIHLTHKFFSHMNYSSVNEEEEPVMNFNIRCDAPFEIKYGISSQKANRNETIKFALKDKKISNDSRYIILNSDFRSCELSFSSSLDDRPQMYGFKIVNETGQLKKIDSLIKTTEVCILKENSDNFIDTNMFSNMTCPEKFDSIKILPEPEDSLHARVIGLLGTDLPSDFIKNGNPYAELDFSSAPKFDSILVSYLVFRADFYGTLIARLLAYHADKGTFVRVLVSDVITLKKDEAMYEKLMALHPNLKFEKYRFDNSQKSGAWISELHRTNHVKLFIAHSKESPEKSMVIIGGRNIHDGFVFKSPIDVSKFPEIVNYVNGDESWAYWRDFEMVIRGQKFVESMVRHYMNFYHINKENLVMKLSSVAIQKENVDEQEEGTMRHYISTPFKDQPNLNIFYSNLIDTAKKKILISSPYFRPVKEIGAALDRAIARGVDITIITRLDLEGDTADFILGAVNKDGVNRFLKKVKVYEYTEPKVILHSKLLMIDDQVSFISSVNLNKRSFYHDLENGVIVNDRKFATEMSDLYSEYLKISRQLTEKQKIVFWKKWLIKVLDKVL